MANTCGSFLQTDNDPILSAPSGHLVLPNAPSTWTDSSQGLNYLEVELDRSSDEFLWCQRVLSGTLQKVHCMNQFNHKILFSKLELERAVRVQNPGTWMAYNYMREKIIADCGGNNSSVDHVATDVSNGYVARNSAANEFFLFHGLQSDYVDRIAKFGMDPRYSSTDGMFGAGLYFADCSSKSNQYVHCGACKLTGAMPRALAKRQQWNRDCKCKQADIACVLLCRCTLGDCLIEKEYRGNAPGDYWHQRRREPEKAGANKGIYNSVLGECRAHGGTALEFRE